MRLICPSCRAQYEVEDDAIPADGRDVQCGSCTTTWFQPHALTLSGAVQAPLSEASKPVFRHQETKSSGGDRIPAPQHMPDDNAADREKLLREIRAEAQQEVSFDAKSRIEREPLPNNPNDETGLTFAAADGDMPSEVRPALQSTKTAETDLNTADVHSYPASKTAPDPVKDIRAAGSVEESFMQNLRSQIEEQNSQPDNFVASRSSSVIQAAEKARISLDPAKIAPPTDAARTESVQRSIRDLGPTPEAPPGRRSYSIGVYTAAVLFLLAVAAYLLRSEITRFYPAAGPALQTYAGYVDYFRLIVQDLWSYSYTWVAGLIGSDAATT